MNPHIWRNSDVDKHGFMMSSGGKYIQVVHFDVALTVTKGAEAKGGLGILIAGIGLSTQGQSLKEEI